MLLLTALLPRLRLAFLTLTVLMVLGLNHQSVATLRVLPKAGIPARAAVTARMAVIKQRVNLEATPPGFGAWQVPAATTWLPPFPARRASQWGRAYRPTPRPRRVPAFFRARLLRVALSPQAP